MPSSKKVSKREMAKRAYKKTREEVRMRDPGVLPKAAGDLLDKVGDDIITSVEVVRVPVEKYATALMEGVSLGKFNNAMKESPYDTLFHLSLVLNDRYVLQKCEVIRFADGIGTVISPDSETMDVPIPSDVTEDELTFRDLFANTKEGMGDQAFTGYHARSNNCQDFVLGVLKYNSLSTPEVDSFVKQDAEQVFEKMPKYMGAMSKAMTDTAAVADKIKEDALTRVDEELRKEENPSKFVEKYRRAQRMASDAEKSIGEVESKMKGMLSTAKYKFK